MLSFDVSFAYGPVFDNEFIAAGSRTTSRWKCEVPKILLLEVILNCCSVPGTVDVSNRKMVSSRLSKMRSPIQTATKAVLGLNILLGACTR